MTRLPDCRPIAVLHRDNRLKRVNRPLAQNEFILLMAMLMSLVALAIDAVMPALPAIAEDLGARSMNDRQLVISSLFFGLAIGTFIYGPISDSVGRKPPIYVGFALFVFGTLISLFASDFSTMLLGRVLQGVGIAAPRIVANAIVRDLYRGRDMARIMSLIMGVFVMVPALAPLIGQGMMLLGGWRAIFVSFLVLSALTLMWFSLRQPESLPPTKRAPFSLSHLMSASMIVIKQPVARGYTIAIGLVFGPFVGYLNSTQQILQELYGLGDRFPLVFALIAVFFGIASYANARLVMQWGMRDLSYKALWALCVASVLFFLVAWVMQGKPPLVLLILYLGLTFFCVAILFGNLNAMAMEPKELGAIAGIAAALIGSVSTLIAAPLGGLIGHLYNETVLPLAGGFALSGSATLAVFYFAEKRPSP